MRSRPHTLIVGDTTAGALSVVVERMAPMGGNSAHALRYCMIPQAIFSAIAKDVTPMALA